MPLAIEAPWPSNSFLVPCVHGETESEDLSAIQHLAMAQRAARVIIAGAPMLLHAQPRELGVLGMTP